MADGQERPRGLQGDHRIGDAAQGRDGLGRGHRDGQDDTPGPSTSQDLDGGAGGGAGGQPVVDNDDGAAGDGQRRAGAAVAGQAPFQLGPFGPDDAGQVVGWQPDAGDQRLVEQHGAVLAEDAQGQLGLPGAAQLADDQDLQRRLQGPGDLCRDEDTAAGQADHDRGLYPFLLEPPASWRPASARSRNRIPLTP